MNEDAFNMSVRKFLKQVGITAQREIESAVRDALAQGGLAGSETLEAKATITLASTKLHLVVNGDIELD
ncbi:MAG: hypothetical protein C0484_22720 [Rhodospirillum sp.]|nr:hypothetical protein [Rhodospirillum sp.]